MRILKTRGGRLSGGRWAKPFAQRQGGHRKLQVDPVHLRYTDASTQTTPEPAPLATSVARGTQVEAATLPPAAHMTTDGTIAAERRAADAAMMRLEAGYLSIMQAVQQLRLDFNMQAMQPATMQPGAADGRAKPSYAAAASPAPKEEDLPPAAPPRQCRWQSLAASQRDRRTFILHVTAVASASSAMAVVHSVLQSLPGKWADGLGPSSLDLVVDANFLGARPYGTGGAARILFTVGSADVADAVVRSRCGLKGSGSSIFEAHSDRERAQHKALWPANEAARASGQKAHFVLSIPVARSANWFLAGGGSRMDEEEATAAAAERIAAAAEDGTSLPVRLATDVVRFLYGGTGRREPADGGVVSASLINAKPAVGGIGVEPRGRGVLRVLFTVASDAVADTVVRWRHELRRCVDSTAVFDVLSDREEAQHQALWPAFLAAKVAGKRAQFHRARLVVDGERVPAPAC
ncbi:hypothetical protein FOA52_016013 [Chlamydomonas sp. UWO 241]|nr:hypothetical protein FOA52_016013 [Chlamydomonas sp. UWO 241]